MLHQGANPRPGTIPLPLHLRQRPVTMTFPLSEVPGPRRTSAEDFPLPGVRRVPPDTGLPPVKKIGKHPTVMHMGRGGDDRRDQLGTAVDPDMSLHPKEPLIALSRLMHLGIPPPVLALRRTRRTDDRGVHNGPGVNLETVLLEIFPDESKEPRSQLMTLQQMAELADGGLVRHGLPPEVDPDEAAHGSGIVERFLDRRVREIEPVRQEGNPSQALDADRRAAAALALGVERLEDGRKLRLGNEAVHHVEKLFAAGGFAGLLETFVREGLLAPGGSPRQGSREIIES